MTEDSFEVVRGSGNVYRDLGVPDADVRQAKAIVGAEIMRILDNDGLTTRAAEARTGVSHSEFSRIRRAQFNRFTIDRLIAIFGKLGYGVRVSVEIAPRTARAPMDSSFELRETTDR